MLRLDALLEGLLVSFDSSEVFLGVGENLLEDLDATCVLGELGVVRGQGFGVFEGRAS